MTLLDTLPRACLASWTWRGKLNKSLNKAVVFCYSCGGGMKPSRYQSVFLSPLASSYKSQTMPNLPFVKRALTLTGRREGRAR